MRIKRLFLLQMILGVMIASNALAADKEALVSLMKGGGHLLMIRHALAPGSGDPDHFQIGDCATQRNLNEEGRRQAAKIGQWLRRHGILSARMYSSQWCRALETAGLMGMGKVEPLPALNSFYGRPRDRAPNMGALRRFLAEQPQDGPLMILVTHYVNIAALTGEGVSSGEGVVVRLSGEGQVRLWGRLDFGL